MRCVPQDHLDLQIEQLSEQLLLLLSWQNAAGLQPLIPAIDIVGHAEEQTQDGNAEGLL
jgi:hypothetical protein